MRLHALKLQQLLKRHLKQLNPPLANGLLLAVPESPLALEHALEKNAALPSLGAVRVSADFYLLRVELVAIEEVHDFFLLHLEGKTPHFNGSSVFGTH